MAKKDPRIDAYIAKSAAFAKPILKHIRALVHEGCPDVEETMKWSFPHFMYKGMLCSMASFKEHCAFGFWKGSLIIDQKSGRNLNDEAMGNFGRITAVRDLPSDRAMFGFIRDAVKLNDDGVKNPARAKATKKAKLVVPAALTAALKKNKKAQKTFNAFNYSKKKDYAEWIAEARSDTTRKKRLASAIQWMAEGKSRNWKYETN